MTTRTIEVIVSPSGDVRLATRGFTGNQCQVASRFLEDALGIPSSEQLTGEFYHSAVQTQQIEQQGGPG